MKPSRIQFKNTIREVEAQLIAAGLRPQDARDLLAQADSLDNYEFWQHQEEGLALYYHRVDSLIVPVGYQCWGLFDPGTSKVQLHEAQEPGDEDLLDLAALHTLINGGTVYAVEPDQVPGQDAIAAILRY